MVQRATQGCMADHPALRAWSEIVKVELGQVNIEVLKNRRASLVCCLAGLGPGGSNVIAKRYPAPNGLTEYRIYREVLCRLPLTFPRHHGLVQEEGTGFCWAFFEDAAGERYSPQIQQHTMEAAACLAVLHTSACEVARDLALPERGPRHYLDYLSSGRNRIRRSLASAVLSGEDRGVLAELAAQCDAVEAQWELIERLCNSAPQTFVHADLYEANIHVRTGPAGVTLVPFDWESAGWGVPAIDLALEGIDLAAYCSIVRRVWPGLDLRAVRALSAAGRLFQLAALIEWESRGLESEWLRRRMKHMKYYQSAMSDAIRVISREAAQ